MKSKFSIWANLFSLIFTLSVISGQELRVVADNSSFLQLEYKPIYTDTTKVKGINGEEFIRVNFLGGDILNPQDYGSPAIPVINIPIGVPTEYGNTIEVLTAEYREIPGRIIPIPLIKQNLQKIVNFEYSAGKNYYDKTGGDLVSFSDYAMVRDLPVQYIQFNPVSFDAEKGVIRLYTKINIRINFSQDQKVNPQAADPLMDGSVVNYKTAKKWTVKKKTELKKDVQNSVLAEGKWYRFEVNEEGIYKISRALLASAGIDVNSVDPGKVKVYNNGGRILPESLSYARPPDLQENAVYAEGAGDNKFDENDFVLFYARGTQFWEYDTTLKAVRRYLHPYSSKNYYWINVEGNDSRKMASRESLQNQPNAVPVETTQAYLAWEEDRFNLMSSGRYYVGDDYSASQKTRTYVNTLNEIVAGSQIRYRFEFANRAEASSKLVVSENDQPVVNTFIMGIGSEFGTANDPGATRYYGDVKLTANLPENRSILKFYFEPTSDPATGYLNFFEFQYQKYLRAVNDELLFYSKDTTALIQYNLHNFTNTGAIVFDITDNFNVKIVSNLQKSLGDVTFQMPEQQQKVSKYLAVNSQAIKTPGGLELISNSNLHGYRDGARFLIITHKNFRSEAERLKAHKESKSEDKISTYIADVDEIYNEFSGGLQDVSAIRDYIKYAYDNWTVKPEFVLLFGDGDYDYKNVEGKGQNFIPTYQSEESYMYIYSYTMDDYFGCVSGNDLVLDLAIGRINVTNSGEAKDAVDKIINYENSQDYGSWRNLITLVADDGWTSESNDWGTHNDQSERLESEKIAQSFDRQKIYLAAYPEVQISTGRRKPAVNKAIIDAINNGTVILNWVGHGNPDVWAHEYVFEKGTTIPQLVNDKYFFLTAATCDFGRFDVPGVQSSTELMLLKPNSGTIGTFTAARTVYSNQNAALNEEFYSQMMQRDSTGQIKPIGISYFLTKVKKSGTNDRKFLLFGDPTIRLKVPRAKASIDSINGSSLNSVFQVKALSKIRVSGSVRDNNGSVDESYNGEAVVTIHDSQRNIELNEILSSMTVPGGIIFNGRTSVTNGRFTTELVVPKDISYENKNGKIVAYIYNPAKDGVGFTNQITVGGTDTTVKNDGKGPEIDISFDNISSENSYLVNPDFTLMVKLKDETGLNTTGNGIGHSLEGVLNGNEASPIDFSNHFTGDLNQGGRSGVVNYKFDGLDYGDYKIEVKAWDVFNNFSTSDKNFTVVNGNDLVIRDVVNYPNPFSSNTTFTFQHNLTVPVDVKINVYTVAGRKIKELETYGVSDRFVGLDWDGRDEDGNSLANGAYLYKLVVRSTDGKFKQEVLGKLAVIR